MRAANASFIVSLVAAFHSISAYMQGIEGKAATSDTMKLAFAALISTMET
jgi:hypothetical protein